MTPAERRFENNKLVSFAIVIGVVVIALSQFTEALQKLRALLFPHPKPNVTLAEANNWKKGPPPIEEPYRPLPPKLQQRFDQEIENLSKAGFVIGASSLTTYRVEEPTTIK